MIGQQKKFLHYYDPEAWGPLIPVYALHYINEKWLLKYSIEENEIFFNQQLFETAVSEIDKPGNTFGNKINQALAKNETQEQGIFLLIYDGIGDNTFLHSVPHYIMVNNKCRLFFNYTQACRYGKYLSKDVYIFKLNLPLDNFRFLKETSRDLFKSLILNDFIAMLSE